jgi:hypothetical protein
MRTWVCAIILSASIVSCTEKGRDNPTDPGGKAFVRPSVSFLTSLPSDSTFTSNALSIEWNGNADSCEFRYMLSPIETWSEWTKTKKLSYTFLDDTSYAFHVEVRYSGNKDTVALKIFQFKIKGVQGPAIKFYKLKTTVPTSKQNFSVSLNFYEVVNFFSGSFKVGFDKTKLRLDSVVVGNVGTSQGFMLTLLPDYSVKTALDRANQNGIVELTGGVLPTMPNPPSQSVNGSGMLARLVFTKLGTGETDLYLTEKLIQDPNGIQQQLNASINARIVIQ